MATRLHCDRCDEVIDGAPGLLTIKRHHKTQVPELVLEVCNDCVDIIDRVARSSTSLLRIAP